MPGPGTAGYLCVLARRSFHALPGQEYNRYRERVEHTLPPETLFYEVSLLEPKPWPYLRDRVYPAFARHLRAKRRSPETAPGVIVSVFHAGTCSLISGEEFLQAFKEIEQLDEAQFRDRLRRWLRAGSGGRSGDGGGTLLISGPPG